MKPIIKAILTSTLAMGLVSTVSAQPPGKGNATFQPGIYKRAETQQEIQKLKPGYHYALVCMDCKSVTVKEIKDEKDVEALCHEGGTLHCDGCKKKVTIKQIGTPGKGTTSTKITYVNAEGKGCMFVVPVKD